MRLPRELLLLQLSLLAPQQAAGRHGSSSETVDQVLVELYYSPRCPRCLEFVQASVMPLLEAGLPGDQVKITVLPVPFSAMLPAECEKSAECSASVAPLCALNKAPPPTRVDSPELLPALRFVECALGHTAGALNLRRDSVEKCAGVAGVSWESMRDCMFSREVFDLMRGKTYQENAIKAMRRLDAEGFGAHVGLPLVFLNGELLRCDRSGCSAKRTPDRDVPLEHPGSLLSVTCSRLRVRPSGCTPDGDEDGAGSGGERAVVEDPGLPCEDCAEVGRLRWREGASFAPVWYFVIAAGAVCAPVLVLLAWIRRQRHANRCRSHEELPLAGAAAG